MAPFQNRMAKCRAKKKEDAQKFAEYLEKDRLRKKKKREEDKEKRTKSKKLDDAMKKKKCEEMRRYRQKKAEKAQGVIKTPEKALGSYHCTSTLRKAVKKVLPMLPKSPSKKRAVVRQLVKDTFTNKGILSSNSQKSPRSNDGIPDIEKKVIAFYNQDGISSQAPGKRDFKSLQDDKGQKVHVQKRYMLMKVEEAFAVFIEKHGNDVIGKSKFYDLRPKNIFTYKNTPHNVCVCVIHANFMFLVNALKDFFQDPGHNHKSLLQSLCCDIKSEKCMTNQCKICYNDVSVLFKPDCNMEQNTKYKKWAKSDGGILKVVEIENVPLRELVKGLNKSLPNFKTHTHTKNQQLEYFEMAKNNLLEDECVVQVDFAENYSLIQQDEIQSAHWQHAQTTLFTCCMWFKGNETKSYVVVSDDLTHSKDSSWVFLKTVINDIQRSKQIQKIFFFSDNCAGQFKSKFTIYNLLHLEEDLNVSLVEWNTFAPGHGKGAVDGIGGLVKRSVWLSVKARGKIVSTPHEFYECAINSVKKIRILFVDKDEIKETSQNLLVKRWENACPISGIRNMHSFKKISENRILGGLTAFSSHPEIINMRLDHISKKKTLQYTEVYSSSSDEEEDVVIPDTEQSDSYENFTHTSVKPGVFITVELKSESRSQKYLGICQTEVDEQDDVRVVFLKHFGNDPQIFIVNEDDEQFVSF